MSEKSKLTKNNKIQAGKYCPFAERCANHNPNCPSAANHLFKDYDFYCKHADQFNDIEQFPEKAEELCDICGFTPTVCECLKEAKDSPSLSAVKDGEDIFNSPNHYTWHPSGVEVITIVQEFTYNIGVAMAYLWRCGHKTGVDMPTDLKKAIKHLIFEAKRQNIPLEELEKLIKE